MTNKSLRETELEQAVAQEALKLLAQELAGISDYSSSHPFYQAVNALREYRASNPPELLPCPFCGADRPTLESTMHPEPMYFIICGSCDSDGPSSGLKGNAIRGWNTRVARPEAEKVRSDYTDREILDVSRPTSEDEDHIDFARAILRGKKKQS